MKKCEIVSTTRVAPGYLGGGPVQKDCVRLLGASVGINVHHEQKHANVAHIGKHKLFFRRLRLGIGPWTTAMLAYCGVTKGGFLLPHARVQRHQGRHRSLRRRDRRDMVRRQHGTV